MFCSINEVLPCIVFMSLTSIFIKLFLHLCSVLWITLSCLFCAVSCKSATLLLYPPFKFCLFYKCRTRSDLSFSVLLLQCKNSFPFLPSFHSRVHPSQLLQYGSTVNYSLRKNWSDFLSAFVSPQHNFYNSLSDILFITSDQLSL